MTFLGSKTTWTARPSVGNDRVSVLKPHCSGDHRQNSGEMQAQAARKFTGEQDDLRNVAGARLGAPDDGSNLGEAGSACARGYPTSIT